MTVIDCQSHVFPSEYAAILTRNRNRVYVIGDGKIYQVDYGIQQFQMDLEHYSIEKKLLAMDQSGIDISILSVNIPGPEWLDDDLRISGAECCNNALADICTQHPDRFAGLAILPLPDVDAAIDELNRAVNILDFRGVVMFSHFQDILIDDFSLEPIFTRLEELDIPIVLHPTIPTWGESIRDYSMIPMFGFMVDTSIAMLRLILGGVMERHPRLKIVHPHAGGVLPYVMGRVVEQTEYKKRGRENITQSPMAYYQNVFLDLVSPSSLAMRYAYEFSGPERLLFGSDHPWVDPLEFFSTFGSLELPAADRQKILADNAIRLFKL